MLLTSISVPKASAEALMSFDGELFVAYAVDWQERVAAYGAKYYFIYAYISGFSYLALQCVQATFRGEGTFFFS